MQIFLVGGALRDEQLGIAPRERDWCVVGARPKEMLDLGYRQVGKDFPVFLHPDSGEEYALARTERKTGPGYHGFAFNTSPDIGIEDDLGRRDLTINAMARAADGELIDPYNGAADIAERKLRHVSDAFREDPVRILRTAKFAARFKHLGFTVADETLDLMREMVRAGEVDALVPDRVWKETAAALSGNDAPVYFDVLRSCGALAVVFPEIDALFGIPQPAQWHPEIDCGVHTMMVLQQASALSNDLAVRFAALVHDLGKALTPKEQLPSHPGHEKESVQLIRELATRLPVPVAARDLALAVAEFHGHAHRALELKPATVLKLLEKTDAFRRPERFAGFLLACEADARGRLGLEDRAYPQAAYLAGALDALSGINVAELIAELPGEARDGQKIAAALRNERLRRLAAHKKTALPLSE